MRWGRRGRGGGRGYGMIKVDTEKKEKEEDEIVNYIGWKGKRGTEGRREEWRK